MNRLLASTLTSRCSSTRAGWSGPWVEYRRPLEEAGPKLNRVVTMITGALWLRQYRECARPSKVPRYRAVGRGLHIALSRNQVQVVEGTGRFFCRERKPPLLREKRAHSDDRSMPGGRRRAYAGFRTHPLRFITSAVKSRTFAPVKNRKEPDSHKTRGHGKQGGRGVREDLLRVVKYVDPDRLRKDRQSNCGDQTRKAPDRRATRGAIFPQHRHEQHREIRRRGKGKGQ